MEIYQEEGQLKLEEFYRKGGCIAEYAGFHECGCKDCQYQRYIESQGEAQ